MQSSQQHILAVVLALYARPGTSCHQPLPRVTRRRDRWPRRSLQRGSREGRVVALGASLRSQRIVVRQAIDTIYVSSLATTARRSAIFTQQLAVRGRARRHSTVGSLLHYIGHHQQLCCSRHEVRQSHRTGVYPVSGSSRRRWRRGDGREGPTASLWSARNWWRARWAPAGAAGWRWRFSRAAERPPGSCIITLPKTSRPVIPMSY